MDLSYLAKSGLTDAEIAKILGTTRITAWKYRTGKALPRDGEYRGVDLYARLRAALEVLADQLEKGRLPRHDLVLHRYSPEDVRDERAALVQRLTELVDAKFKA